eukprot:jgi/Chrzof1/6210/Cz17g15190.t1
MLQLYVIDQGATPYETITLLDGALHLGSGSLSALPTAPTSSSVLEHVALSAELLCKETLSEPSDHGVSTAVLQQVVAYNMALAVVHASKDAAVLQLTDKNCMRGSSLICTET